MSYIDLKKEMETYKLEDLDPKIEQGQELSKKLHFFLFSIKNKERMNEMAEVLDDLEGFIADIKYIKENLISQRKK